MQMISWRLWGLAIVSGMLQVSSFPVAGPLPLWRTSLCWLALVPLLWSVLSSDRNHRPVDALQGAFLGYTSGFVFYLGNCYWIFETMNLYGGLPRPVAAGILVLFSLYLGLYHALFGALLATARLHFGKQTALLLMPFLWVAVELARARITGFPWDLLGIAQVDNSLLTRLAPLTGAYGLSFVVAAINALWLLRIQVRERKYTRQALTAACLVLLLLYVVASKKMPAPRTTPTANATLVQENLEVGAANTGPPETIADKLAIFSALSRHPAHVALNGIPGLSRTRLVPLTHGRSMPDVIIWPESPADFHTNDPAFQAATSDLAQATSSPLILGSLGVVPDLTSARGGRLYDSAALVRADGTQSGRYDKIHLVPFGEYVPFKEMFFFAGKLTAGVGDMDRGTQRTVFRTQTPNGTHSFGIFVCYESIFGDEVRQFVRNGAEVLVNISDDGWYGDSGAAWQHLNMVRMRAIENHRWVVRATNTGITASIDPFGRVIATLPRRIRASVNVPYGYEQGTTFYTRHGDWFAYLCTLVTLAMLGMRLRHPVN